MLFALAASNGWDIWQIDIVTAFLHPTIDENVYMELPEGYGENAYGKNAGMLGAGHAIAESKRSSKPSTARYVCKLKKTLYGFKQAP